MQTELLKVTGMTCGGCTGQVTQALKNVSGVRDVDASLANGEASVRYEERLTSPEQLIAAVRGAGYGITEGVTEELTADMAAMHKPQSKGCCG